jgi:fructose-bisphosphate aldolase, class II
MLRISEIFQRARRLGIAIPAFNIPYLPMMLPVTRAVADQNAFALIETARLEWLKFESGNPQAVAKEFERHADREHLRLHLDHVPVIDEDGQRVDFLPIFEEAIDLGYESVMIDGSRLPLAENINATQQVVELAHAAGVPVEAELGAVFGHESGILPPYEELFSSGQGFTDVDDARHFVHSSGCDWLSVAVGNIHGAITAGRKDEKKVEARLDVQRIRGLAAATQAPLVLHGGSGIQQAYVLDGFKNGIVKINVGTEIRQVYEQALRAGGSVVDAQQAVYDRTTWLLKDFYQNANKRPVLFAD